MNTQVNFQIRINDTANIEEIGLRVSKALNCTFTPSEANEFEGDEALETKILGMWITLNYYPDLPEGQMRNYRLTGDVPENIKMPWGDETIDISEYILGVLTRVDSNEWYIPDMNEKLSEAGLDLSE
ncbi:hypothetical protein [Microcoleus vaginatus]|jgi:hypothetical protein|uniref:hypothetical protein n=1 Tax=Microcoleus vaginatus TaxID=119532 RepID=UPI0032AC1AB9